MGAEKCGYGATGREPLSANSPEPTWLLPGKGFGCLQQSLEQVITTGDMYEKEGGKKYIYKKEPETAELL